MWLLLKSEKPEDAWDKLIAGQTETTHAMRAHPTFEHLKNRVEHLGAIEKLIFPPRVFLSAGMIVRKQLCSICDIDYADCSHLVGRPYWGEFYFRRLEDVTADHVAIVLDPANKLCRVTHFSTEGGMRNRMTWRVEPTHQRRSVVGKSNGRLLTRGILLSANDLAP
jgi:hypothetical protein